MRELLFYVSGTVIALIFSILSVEAKLLHQLGNRARRDATVSALTRWVRTLQHGDRRTTCSS